MHKFTVLTLKKSKLAATKAWNSKVHILLSQTTHHFFFCKKALSYLFDRQSYRKPVNFRFTPQMIIMVRAGPCHSQESRAFAGSPMWMHGPKPFFHCFLRMLAGRWITGRAAGTWTSASLGCWYCKRWLNMLCHHIVPAQQFLELVSKYPPRKTHMGFLSITLLTKESFVIA